VLGARTTSIQSCPAESGVDREWPMPSTARCSSASSAARSALPGEQPGQGGGVHEPCPFALGAITVGGVGVAVGRDREPSRGCQGSVALGKKLVQSIRGEFRYPEQEEYLRQRRDYFRQLVLWNKDQWSHEYEWYVQMGGLRRNVGSFGGMQPRYIFSSMR